MATPSVATVPRNGMRTVHLTTAADEVTSKGSGVSILKNATVLRAQGKRLEDKLLSFGSHCDG